MSLEAWGDEDPSCESECRHCEERIEEHETVVKDLTSMLRQVALALDKTGTNPTLISEVKEFIMNTIEYTNTLRTLDTVLDEESQNE